MQINRSRWFRAVAAVAAAGLTGGLAVAARSVAFESTVSGEGSSSAICRPGVVSPGGDWPAYGGDAHNTRSQPAETQIGPANASALTPAWTFAGQSVGGSGGINATPVEADGCVFIGTSTGYVYAIDASNGHPAWAKPALLPVPNPGLGGAIVGSPAVEGDSVYILVNQTVQTGTAVPSGSPNGPYVAALDIRTGAVKWLSAPLATYPGDYTNASPVVMPTSEDDEVVFAGFSPPEGDSHGQGGFDLIDAETGARRAQTFTIPPSRQATNAGGGIWSTPAYDARTGFAYVGAGNPDSKQQEDPDTDAILKVSLHDDNLGAIVAAYKGNPDQYTQTLRALTQSPACAASEAAPTPLDDPVCGQIDLDFGAAPNLFTVGGELMVGDLQKAGVYHVADASTMKLKWDTIVGAPCQACNAASTAFATGTVFGVSAPGGATYALAGADGSRTWTSATPDATHYESVSVANGVVYTYDNQGALHTFDASSGTPLSVHPMAADIHQPSVTLTSGGVSIAHHLVLVAVTGGVGAGLAGGTSVPTSLADTYVIAYELPA